MFKWMYVCMHECPFSPWSLSRSPTFSLHPFRYSPPPPSHSCPPSFSCTHSPVYACARSPAVLRSLALLLAHALFRLSITSFFARSLSCSLKRGVTLDVQSGDGNDWESDVTTANVPTVPTDTYQHPDMSPNATQVSWNELV